MIESMRDNWRRFKAGKPGHRFQDRYRRRQRASQGKFDLRRISYIAGGIALALASLILGWAPGLGTVTFVIGLAMVAGELWPAARLLDWTEVKLRELARLARRIWITSTPGEKALIVLAILACIVAVGYGAYRLLFGG